MRASSCRTVRGRPDIAHTSTPARWHASSARMPRSVKPPSPSRVTAPPAPSSVPSRSTYRQRTPALWRASADGERAPGHQVALAMLAAGPVPGPQDPPVRAVHQPVALAAIAPAAAQLVLRLGRPSAEDLLAVAEELDVVVAGAGDPAPAQQRRPAQARASSGRQEVLGRRVGGRGDGGRAGRGVACDVFGLDDVRVSPAVLEPGVRESVARTVVDDVGLRPARACGT